MPYTLRRTEKVDLNHERPLRVSRSQIYPLCRLIALFKLTHYPAITISVVRRRQEMMVVAALRRLDALQLVR